MQKIHSSLMFCGKRRKRYNLRRYVPLLLQLGIYGNFDTFSKT